MEYKVIKKNKYILAYAFIEKVHNNKKEHAASYELLELVMENEFGINLSELTINKGEHGKPYFSDCDIKFNISHCKGMVAVALSKETELGIDAENVRACREKVAERVFCESEKAALENSQDKDLFFFLVWTFKEAVIKYTGAGLSCDISRLDFLRDVQGIEQFVIEGNDDRYVITVKTDVD